MRRGEIAVPGVIGLSLEEAAVVLEETGMRLLWLEERDRFDAEVSPGRIALQDPKSATPAKRGSVVEVGLSLGRELVEVPELVGQSMQTVRVQLGASGLTLGRSFRIFAPDGAEGRVVRQIPQAGAQVVPATPVDLFIRLADSASSFVMPDLIYSDYETVRSFFESRGFRLGSVKYEAYEGAAPGAVLRQHPLPGHRLARRDVISLVVAAGGRRGEVAK